MNMEKHEAPIGGFEKTMQTCGYKFKETVQIDNRAIQVYEKPLNPKYVIEEKKHPNNLQDYIFDLAEELNKNLILVDGFDKEHIARDNWARTLAGSDAETYLKLKKKNKLKNNRINNINQILAVTGREIKTTELKENFRKLYEDFLSFSKSKKYQELSLNEKILYMEEIDRIAMEILDLLKHEEQSSSS